MSDSEIKTWYANKNVLVTGATGFVGKVIVERILRECDDVSCVYLIVRAKKNFDVRCQEFLKQVAFDYLRENKPTQLEKIKIMEGDLTQEHLGLSRNDLTEILDNVDIVLHSGADVRFNLPLRDIFNTNTFGTYRLLELATNIKRLQVFVIVSTAYSQSHQQITEERHYDGEMDAFVLLKGFDRFDDQTILALQPKLLKEFPNTYSFSKHLSEDLVQKYRDQFPICVIRPSIVMSAIRDPMPGYTEGLNGVNGWSFASLRGVLRTTYTNKAVKLQLIPVDIVANTVIAASWIHGTNKENHIKYYNVNMLRKNLESFYTHSTYGRKLLFKYPLDYSLWCPNTTPTKSLYYYHIRTSLYQILPSALLDMLIWIFRCRPIMLKIQRKIIYGLDQVAPYLKEMKFETENFENIQKHLSRRDNEIFNTDINDLTAFKAAVLVIQGVRKFIAKEKDEDLPKARRNILIWYWIHMATKFIVVCYLAKFVFERFF